MSNNYVFVDTSVFYAAMNFEDSHHREAIYVFKMIASKHKDIILTNFVVAETHALLVKRLGIEAGIEWLENIPGKVERITKEDEDEARKIIFKYRDKAFSYCDTTSFAMIKRLKIEEVFSFDKHFKQYPGLKLLDIEKGGQNE